ncbi:MAG: DUF4256 domain-containing protein [Methanobacteriota archaeon]|nr:MAG: DUF4256 domain-containing protein [Euryarchaeota archaeon]
MSKKSSKKLEQIDLTQFQEPLTQDQTQKLLEPLKKRFEGNQRVEGIKWEDIEDRLNKAPDKLRILHAMEITGGEPDVIGIENGEIIFCDCSPESPKGRRSLTYDREGQTAREKKGIYPPGNAVGMAEAMGIDLLTEEMYFQLQNVGNFDSKTSSWLKTPAEIRKLGGAIFGDFRFNRVFVYHNTTQSFYSSRGFRGMLRV